VALRVPKAVICLISALAYHEITTAVPHEVQIAVPRGTRTPRVEYPPIRMFRFTGGPLVAGIEEPNIDGTRVRIYGPEKTVADCFRFRNKLGIDVAIEALNFCIERKRAKPVQLLHYARICRVEKVMVPYLQARQ
jgi:predicted transcriptional regulator of viral defense system